MARIIPNVDRWHAITIRGDRGGDFTLVSGGRRGTYLSCHPKIGNWSESATGPETLRALARAILREIPPRKKRRAANGPERPKKD